MRGTKINIEKQKTNVRKSPMYKVVRIIAGQVQIRTSTTNVGKGNIE